MALVFSDKLIEVNDRAYQEPFFANPVIFFGDIAFVRYDVCVAADGLKKVGSCVEQGQAEVGNEKAGADWHIFFGAIECPDLIRNYAKHQFTGICQFHCKVDALPFRSVVYYINGAPQCSF